MSSILVDNSNLVTPQLAPGAKLQYLQDGTITGTTTYNSRLGTAGSGIPIGTAHPYNGNAFCSESEVTYEESTATIFSNYIGVWSSSVQKVTTVSSLNATPITQCPNWYDDAGTAPDGALNNYAFKDPFGQFGGFASKASDTGPGTIYGDPTGSGIAYPNTTPYRLSGVSSYYLGAVTIRINYSATSSGTVISALAKLGSTLTSLVAGQITYSFTYYAFLCTSVTYEETPFGVSGAAQWSITEEYLFLQSPGLDPAIYG